MRVPLFSQIWCLALRAAPGRAGMDADPLRTERRDWNPRKGAHQPMPVVASSRRRRAQDGIPCEETSGEGDEQLAQRPQTHRRLMKEAGLIRSRHEGRLASWSLSGLVRTHTQITQEHCAESPAAEWNDREVLTLKGSRIPANWHLPAGEEFCGDTLHPPGRSADPICQCQP